MRQHRASLRNGHGPGSAAAVDSRPTVVVAVGDRVAAERLWRALELEPGGFDAERFQELPLALERLELGGVKLLLFDLALPSSELLPQLLASRAEPVALVGLYHDGLEAVALGALGAGVQECLPWSEAHGATLVRSLRHSLERQAALDRLRSRILLDPLTGLANRAALVDRIDDLLARLRRGKGAGFALLFLDLDRFKGINDSYGHGAGDLVLKAIGARLRESVRSIDTVARLGGDEFAVLVDDAGDVASAIHAAERVLALVAEPLQLEGRELKVSTSVGVALSATGYDRADDILRDADTAMYRAKAGGRNCCRVFDPEMHLSAVALLRLEAELQEAVREQAFVMHYQPILDLSAGRVVGFEALVRWHHERRGLLPVAQFLSVAEESGLIVPIGWWALERACRQTRAWQRRFPLDPPLEVSINVSARQLLAEGMVERLSLILAETALPPATLRLELTEQVLHDLGEAGVARLAEVQKLGVRIGLDDFGTGVSSLSQLRRLRFDAVKIDGTCIREAIESDDSRQLVESILALANRLGLGVIAEGVETEAQADALRALGCPHVQGFHFARPLDGPAAEELLEASCGRDGRRDAPA